MSNTSELNENTLIFGDACAACDGLAPGVRFDMAYIDPPFGVGTTMRARTQKGEARGASQAPLLGPAAYEDRDGTDALVQMLKPVLARIRDRMQPWATLYVHLDFRAVHEVKVLADQIFGRGAFVSEVIWAPGNGAKRARAFPVTHQTILLYARSAKNKAEVVFNASDPALREPYAKTSRAMHFTNKDEDGRVFRERVVNGKTYRYYADEGRRLGSVWSDIPAMVANTPLLAETTGYPTQKPIKLLERIVRASSREGGVVADVMCGSGTTLLAAASLGRRFVGADKSPMAIATAQRRLSRAGVVYAGVDAEGNAIADAPAEAEPL